AAAPVFIPEGAVEGAADPVGLGIELLGPASILELVGPAGGEAERVVPERVDLHRLAVARGRRHALDTGIHPGEVRSRLAGDEQAIARVHPDAVVCPVAMSIEDRQRSGVEDLTEKAGGSAGSLQRVDRLEHPQRRVDGVVLRWSGTVGEAVRYQATIEVCEEALEDLSGEGQLAAGDQQAGGGEQRVPSPVGGPWVGGDDGGRSAGASEDTGRGDGIGPARQQGRRGLLERTGRPRRLGQRSGLERRGNHRRPARRDVEDEAPGPEEVLAEVEAAVELLEILDVLVPGGGRLERLAEVMEPQRWQRRVRLKPDRTRSSLLALLEAGPRVVVPPGQP